MVVLIASAFFQNPNAAAPSYAAPLAPFSIHGLVAAILGCFVAYDGWQYIALVAGEVRQPSRNLPLSLLLGTSAVILLYVLANVAYFRVLPVEAIARSPYVAGDVAEKTMGALGGTLIAVMIMISSAGAANGAILTSSRLYFAQARDGLFFRKVAEIHPRFGTPGYSILFQGAWSAILAASGSYEMLITYALFAMWTFHGMAVLSVLILRRKYPERARPYRMWGYPVTALLFVLFAFWFVINTLLTRPVSSSVSVAIMAAGRGSLFCLEQARLQPIASCRRYALIGGIAAKSFFA